MESCNEYFLDHEFDPQKFYFDYYDNDSELLEGITKLTYQVYNSGLGSRIIKRGKNKFKGNSLLDLGTGPNIHSLAAPSQKYTDITLSDLADINIATLKKWLQKDPAAIKYTSLKQAAKVENVSDPSIIEERIRKAVKLVVPCDVLKEIPLLTINRLYDVIQSTYVLDSAARGHSLKGIIQNMGNHLKPGGALVMLNSLGATYWAVGPHKYPKYTLSPEELEGALTDAGYEDIQLHVRRVDENRFTTDLTGIVLSCAFKKC